MKTDGNNRHVLRAAPEPRLKAIPADEALGVAKAAFTDARQTQLSLLSGGLNGLLFSPKSVTYVRLTQMRHAARQQVDLAQQVARSIDDAIDAFKSTEQPAR